MKKLAIPLILIFLLIIPAVLTAGELELGLGFTPFSSEDISEDAGYQEESLLSFHVGYSFWWLFYASWDSIIVPPFVVESMTSEFVDEGGETFYKEGYYRPGFLNMFDIGIRPRIGPFLAFAEIGINTLYVYKQDEDELDIPSDVGANIRLGLGLKFRWWGVTGSISSIQPSMEQLGTIIDYMGSGDPFLEQQAEDMFNETLIPTIMFVLYF